MSTIGRLFRVTVFGESNGKMIGVVIDSPPPNMTLDINKVQHQLRRKRSGQGGTDVGKEVDAIEIVSGTEEGVTLGTPLTITINNPEYCNTRSREHGDHTRETMGRVIAGGVADQILAWYDVRVVAFVEQVGDIRVGQIPHDVTRGMVDGSIVRCPDKEAALRMGELIYELKERGESIGGVIGCVILNCPKYLGGSAFDGLKASLAHAIMSIPAVNGFGVESSFHSAKALRSQHPAMEP